MDSAICYAYEWIGNKIIPPMENLHEYLIKVAKKWS